VLGLRRFAFDAADEIHLSAERRALFLGFWVFEYCFVLTDYLFKPLVEDLGVDDDAFMVFREGNQRPRVVALYQGIFSFGLMQQAA
jgi:hypothetical protein